MTRFWIGTETGCEVEADDVFEHPDGRLIFYADGEVVAMFPTGMMLDYGVQEEADERA